MRNLILNLIRIWLSILILPGSTALTNNHAHPKSQHQSHHRRRDTNSTGSSTRPLVFAHYMIIYAPPNGDFNTDIKAAKGAGIDAFAVNYGGWGVDWNLLFTQLERFYQIASTLDFKLFMSYDTTVMSDPGMMVNISNTLRRHPAQLWVDNKIFLSSFSTTGYPPFDWQRDVIDKIDDPVMFMPASICEDASVTAQMDIGSGPMTWIHPAASTAQEADVDLDYSNERKDGSRPWTAGIAPWFFKRISPDMNWLNAQDMGMWFDRWMHLLQLRPTFIELITWNDFSESTFIGPTASFRSNNQVQTASPYGGLSHEGFLNMAKIFIRAFKNGSLSPNTVDPQDEDVFMYYRLQPAMTNGNHDTMDLPRNASDLKDNVHIISFLTKPATLYLDSGGSKKTIDAPAGIGNFSIPWNLGPQSLSMNRLLANGKQLMKKGPAIEAQFDTYQGNVIAL